MIIDDAKERDEFLNSFGELARWPRDVAWSQELKALGQLAATAHDEAFPGAVLPRVRDHRLDLYAIAETSNRWRELAPLLTAFVGVTVSDFRGSSTMLDPEDRVEAFLRVREFAAVSRFSAGGRKDLELLMVRGVLRLAETLRRAEVPHRSLPRATRDVLLDFRLALTGYDRRSAEEAIRFLAENMRLDALNIAFLQVQLDATFLEWEQLHARPFFAALTEARRPPRVSAALVEALYRTIVDPFDAAGDVDGALTAFGQQILPSSGTLFRGQPPASGPILGKAFLLAAIAGGRPDPRALQPLLQEAQSWPTEHARFFHQLYERVPTDSPKQASTVVDGLSLFGTDTDLRAHLARAVALDEPVTARHAKAVLLTSIQLQSLDAYREALEYVKRLSPADQKTFLSTPGVASLWQEISTFATRGTVPRSWLEWLSALEQMDYSQARAIAEAAISEWPVAEHLARPEDVAQLITALQSAPEDRLRDALPFLVDWLRSDEYYPNSDYDRLYDVLLTQLLFSGRQSPAALGAVAELLEARLLLRPAAKDYQLLVMGFAEIASDLASVRTIDWLLDCAELTVLYPCSDSVSRSTLWTSLLSYMHPFASRMSPAQVTVARDLSAALGGRELVDDLATGVPPRSLANIRVPPVVAIYTLTESVGRRIKLALEAEFSDTRVELVHDMVNSPRLQELARRVDLFVVCWQSAKHAATSAIRTSRPSDRPTLYPTGRGSSSILAEIRASFE